MKIQQTIRLLLATFAFISFTACSTRPVIQVSPEGNDRNPGTKAQPLFTLPAALAKARETQASGIQLRAGTYYLDKPIVLDTQDSGTEKQPFVISSYPGEQAVISGGQKLKLSWQPYRNGIMQAKVPAGRQFDQLFLNGRKQIRARYPNYDPTVEVYNGYSADAIAPERVSTWADPVGGYIHAMHRAHWGGYHYEIAGVEEGGEFALIGGYQNNRQMGMHREYRFVEHIFEELDAPGEWFFDRKTSTLYFYPPKNTDLGNALIEVSGLKHLFEISGTPENPVKYIHIEDLELAHTAYTFMDTKEPLLRSDWAIYRGGAILINGAENCQINRNYFNTLGGNGVFVNNYNRRISISGNHFEALGASAICFVGDPNAVRSPSFEYHEFVSFEELDRTVGPKTENYPALCTVHDNLIHDIGRVEKQVAGVQISMASEISVSHNSIYNLPRAGINISEGTWGGHIIEYNDVFNTVLETGDHGSFNSWGRDRFWHPRRNVLDSIVKAEPSLIKLDPIKTTIIRNNRFRCDHGWDIDLDDGSTNYHIYNNLCLSGGIKLREGFYRTVENNIMVNNSFHPHVWFEESGDVFRKNIVMTQYRPIRLDGWGEEIDYNLFPDSASLVIAQAAADHVDRHSSFGNPHFLAPEKGDFRVSDQSPALKLGFQNFPMDSFGVVSPDLRAKAEGPEIPLLIRQEFQVEKQTTFDLLGMTLKNIEGLGEQSAAGLNDQNGVIIMEVQAGSKAADSGLKKGDVIVKSGEHEVKDIRTMYEAYQGDKWKGQLELMVIRNQALRKVTLVIR
jgi:hypothetical protein